jgi:hypothetical protein
MGGRNQRERSAVDHTGDKMTKEEEDKIVGQVLKALKGRENPSTIREAIGLVWQPIDTAPKDGATIEGCSCDVLLFGFDGDGVPGISVGFFAQFWSDSSTGDEVHPTHWMPLPPPPL